MDIFEMLINHGANVDSQDNCGWTILHEAILGKITKAQDVRKCFYTF